MCVTGVKSILTQGIALCSCSIASLGFRPSGLCFPAGAGAPCPTSLWVVGGDLPAEPGQCRALGDAAVSGSSPGEGGSEGPSCDAGLCWWLNAQALLYTMSQQDLALPLFSCSSWGSIRPSAGSLLLHCLQRGRTLPRPLGTSFFSLLPHLCALKPHHLLSNQPFHFSFLPPSNTTTSLPPPPPPSASQRLPERASSLPLCYLWVLN